jgi:hypothetical protein
VFSREFFHQLEDAINRARYEIDEGYHRMSALDKVRQALGGKKATVNYGPQGETYVNLPEKSIRVLPTDTVDDIKAKLANPFERKSMSITDAGKLAGTIKDRINAAKSRIAQVSANTDGALARLNDAADTGDRIAKQIESEAADLLAEIGQFTNGGPE